MIKKWIIRPVRRRWKRFIGWLFSWQKKDVGVCKCSDCKCKRTYKKQKDHATDISFENEIKYDG